MAPTTHYTNAVTPDNHGAWLTVCAALFLSWSLSTLAVRSWIRLRLHGPWGHDDSLITLATFIAACQATAVFLAIHNSYGTKYKMMPHANIAPAEKSLYASQILYVAALCASKLSTSFLVARLTRLGMHVRASYAVSAVSLAWGFASILAVAFRGNLPQPWTTLDGEDAMFNRWLGIELTSMMIEIALFGLSVFLVWGLQMALGLKSIIIGAFACRLFIIPLSCVRLYYLAPSLNPDLSFSTIYAAILTQAVMHYSLIAATIPCTKPFMRPFNSGYVESNEEAQGSHTRSQSRGNRYIIADGKAYSSSGGSAALESSKSGATSRSREHIRAFGDSDFRGDRNLMSSSVESRRVSRTRDKSGTELHRLKSNEMVIRQVTEWEVQREPANGPSID